MPRPDGVVDGPGVVEVRPGEELAFLQKLVSDSSKTVGLQIQRLSVERVRDETGPYLAAQFAKLNDHPLIGETPIVKAQCTAEGFAGASRALQVFGGYGYDAHGVFGLLNDLWCWRDHQWCWVSGASPWAGS